MRRRAVPLAFALLAALAASACSDPEGDPGFEAPASLLGHWQERDVDGVVVSEHDYADDGVVHITYPFGGVTSGVWTYAEDQDAMTLEFDGPGAPSTETTTSVLKGDILMRWAFLPDGPVDGPVGKWRSMIRTVYAPFGGSSGVVDSNDEVLTIHGDGTATYVQTVNATSPVVFAGRWSIELTRFRIEQEGREGRRGPTIDLRYSPDAVIGHNLFERSVP